MIVNLTKAIQIIRAGETVAIPTETVYGLAADAFNINAVKNIFKQKGRPADNPLIVHISSLDQLQSLAENLPPELHALAERFWPGPLSLVLKKRKTVPDIVTGGLETVAVRMPDHALTLQLIEKTGPLTAPSANKSGRPSPTKTTHIIADFGEKLPILNGGASNIGLESTVLDITGDPFIILRPGFIDEDMLRKVTGREIQILNQSDLNSAKRSPGTRYTHYKPKATVKWADQPLNEIASSASYFILHSNKVDHILHNNIYRYNGDYTSMARDLYDHFRTADHVGCHTIYIERFRPDQNHPLIPALQDRIDRAVGN